jgi:hypothetical protein
MFRFDKIINLPLEFMVQNSSMQKSIDVIITVFYEQRNAQVLQSSHWFKSEKETVKN